VQLSGYVWALKQDPRADLRVLDVASGEGFGTHLLGEATRLVVGVDLDWGALVEARQRYRRAHLRFIQMDAQALGFGSGAFDMVVSQDTIEHVADDRGFVAEVARVLKPDGVFAVFTPWRDQHTAKPENPYHLREYSQASLAGILRPHFAEVRFWGRRWGKDLARTEAELNRLRRFDPRGIRSLVPQSIRHRLGTLWLRVRRAKGLGRVSVDDVEYIEGAPPGSTTLIAVCRRQPTKTIPLPTGLLAAAPRWAGLGTPYGLSVASAEDGRRSLISALIPAHNSAEVLPACLASVEALRYPKDRLEVVLVDDASGDATRNQIDTWISRQAGVGWHALKVIANDRNLGAAGARNAGLRHLDPASEYVLCLDADAEIVHDALERLLAACASATTGVVGARIIDQRCQERTVHGAGFVSRWTGRYRERVPERLMECDYVITCGCLYRRQALDAVRGFDPEFFIYHEDTDICLRIKQEGYRVVFEPTALVRHDVSSRSRQTPAHLYYLVRNKFLLLRKHLPVFPRLWAYGLLATFGVARICVSSLRSPERLSALKVRAVLRGVAHGLRRQGGRLVES